ncbi:carboxypeptidase-like regulatory domain-containing protein [uncultured Fibrella sp.]|uniref:carboxypeptidase-like regulatory domain-containing protein n=1 Tax=uncultured Fibrella sp. TaxID=1284596 RepID=UPI0035CC78D4
MYFILGIANLFAQPVHLHVNIKDAATQRPLAYATVYSAKMQTGIYSTENGLVEWTLDASDTVTVSFLSYQTQKIVVSVLREANEILLKETPLSLDEVVIKSSSKRKNIYRIGFYDDDTEFDAWGVGIGCIAVNNIANNTGKIGYLKTLFIDSGKAKKQPHRALARVRIYASDGIRKSPGRDLLNQNIIFDIPRFATHVQVDLSPYTIIFPLEGLFIGFEFLGFDTKKGLVTDWKLQTGANVTSTKRDDYRSVGSSWRFRDTMARPVWMNITDNPEHKGWNKILFKIGAEVETVE